MGDQTSSMQSIGGGCKLWLYVLIINEKTYGDIMESSCHVNALVEWSLSIIEYCVSTNYYNTPETFSSFIDEGKFWHIPQPGATIIRSYYKTSSLQKCYLYGVGSLIVTKQ